jgi:hypothetical protein
MSILENLTEMPPTGYQTIVTYTNSHVRDQKSLLEPSKLTE